MSNTLYAVMASTKPDELGQKIEQTYGGLQLKVAPGEWLIVTPSSKTTTELSSDLGITNGQSGSAIVLRVENYFGHHVVSIWEWITAKMGAQLDETKQVHS